MPTTISVVNQKGGVGKTTTAINLAACLAAAGQQTLLVDLDPQGNASSGVGIPSSELERTIYDALIGEVAPRDILIETFLKNLYLLPANLDLSGAELALIDQADRLERLRGIIEPLEGDFDFIVIDSPPSLSILALNVLAAAHQVIIPVQCEYYALEGLSSLLQTLDRVRDSLNPRLEILGVLMTMFDRRTRLSQEVVDEVRRSLADKVFETVIPRSVKLSEAPSFGKPIIFHDFNSPGSIAYIQLCQEVLARVEKNGAGKGTGRAAEGAADEVLAESVEPDSGAATAGLSGSDDGNSAEPDRGQSGSAAAAV